MDIISPPAVREETVIDFDAGFTSGEVRSFTVHEGDTIEYRTEPIALIVVTLEGPPKEVITFYSANLTWTSERTWVRKIPVPLPTVLPEETDPQEPARL